MGNGTKVRLSNMAWDLHSSDPTNMFTFMGSFSSTTYDGLSGRAVGIDYGPDGIKGTGDDVRITTGSTDQLVDEIVFVGRGNAMANDEASCPGADQTTLDCVKALYDSIMPFTITTDYILLDDFHNRLAFASGTVFFGNTALPPDLTCAKVHQGDFVQGDPGTALGTYITGPVANSKGAFGTSAPGFGPSAWQASATSAGQKAEVYVSATTLFGHPVNVGDIASISWWTNKTVSIPGDPDWYNIIYTAKQNNAGDNGSWYRSKLNSEPYLSGGPFVPVHGPLGLRRTALIRSGTSTSPGRAASERTQTRSSPISPRAPSTGRTMSPPAPSGIIASNRCCTSACRQVRAGRDWLHRHARRPHCDPQNGRGRNRELRRVRQHLPHHGEECGHGTHRRHHGHARGHPSVGLTAVSFTGDGWTTDLVTLIATRTDVLGPGSSYPPLTLKVAVASSAPPSVTNTATVSGGGDLTPNDNTASDPARVQQIPTHLTFTTPPTDGQPGQTLPAVVVQVQDAGNQVVTDYSGSVTLSLTGGTSGAVLTGGGATATSSGVASFPGLSVDLMGLSYALSASSPYGAGTLTGTSAPFNITNPTPSLVSLSPFELAPGQPDFTLTVTGSNFMSGSTVYFNGAAMVTTFVSPTQLTAAIPAAQGRGVRHIQCRGQEPPLVLADSNPLTFTVGNPTVVYVNGLWTGQLPGLHPTASTPSATTPSPPSRPASARWPQRGRSTSRRGIYGEKLLISKALALRSQAGAASTTIRGPDDEPYVVGIYANGVTVDGFSVTSPGYAGYARLGRGH